MTLEETLAECIAARRALRAERPPRQHQTHDAPMKPGKRPGC